MPLTVAPEQIDLSFTPRQRREAAAVELDHQAVVYRGGEMHRFDELATLLWNCFDGTTSLEELVDDLVAVYGADRAIVAHDVLAFARFLGREGLLENVEVPQIE